MNTLADTSAEAVAGGEPTTARVDYCAFSASAFEV